MIIRLFGTAEQFAEKLGATSRSGRAGLQAGV